MVGDAILVLLSYMREELALVALAYLGLTSSKIFEVVLSH